MSHLIYSIFFFSKMNSVSFALSAFFLIQVHGGYIPPGPKYTCPKEGLLLHPCWCTKESDYGVEVACNNTNLASMSVALNNLATYDMPIQKLTIYRCHISESQFYIHIHIQKTVTYYFELAVYCASCRAVLPKCFIHIHSIHFYFARDRSRKSDTFSILLK